jgi:hypothetical protein
MKRGTHIDTEAPTGRPVAGARTADRQDLNAC